MRARILFTACAAAVIGLYGTQLHSQPAPGEYILPDANTPVIPGSTLKTGGLSSLFYAGGNDFWAITDRGPNVTASDGTSLKFLTPNFNPTIFRIHLNAGGTFSIIDSLRVQRTGGGPTSGLPNPAPFSTGEVALDINEQPLGTDDWGFDTEGILRAPDGTFWFCEEYAPGIAQLSSVTGQIIRRVRPGTSVGDLPDILKKRTPNRGFEGIAMTPNGKIYAIVQSGMLNSFANTPAANTAAGNNTEMFRLVEYDPSTGVSRMFVYLMDAGYPVTGSNLRRVDIKIGDMSPLNDSEILMIEHAQRGTENVKKIYKINLNGATPITTETFTVSAQTKTLEELTRTEIGTVAGLTPVSKTLVLDLLNPGAGNPVWPTELDKAEGLAVINSTTLAVGNDNDFGVAPGTPAGAVAMTGKPSKVLVYSLSTALDFRLPVELTGFDLASSKGSVYLNWRTASEVSNAGFEVYRAPGSDTNYRMIASWISNPELAGLGTTSHGKSYSLTDAELQPGTLYSYRLVDVSTDGIRTGHPAKSIRVESDQTLQGVASLRLNPIAPNPATSEIGCSFSLVDEGAVTLEIFSKDGRLVATPVAAKSYPAGGHTVTVPTAQLPSGAYMLRLSVGVDSRVQRFVVMR